MVFFENSFIICTLFNRYCDVRSLLRSLSLTFSGCVWKVKGYARSFTGVLLLKRDSLCLEAPCGYPKVLGRCQQEESTVQQETNMGDVRHCYCV